MRVLRPSTFGDPPLRGFWSRGNLVATFENTLTFRGLSRAIKYDVESARAESVQIQRYHTAIARRVELIDVT